MIGATVSTTYFNHLLGKRSFEGVNHLGNVLTVFSDRKFPQNSGGDVSGFKAELFTSQDYYPFGMVMPGRDFSANDYRYGFNGKESINEVKGTGNWQDYGMRMYDNRICRFPSVDPIAKQFPYYSPYQYAGNKPIVAIDLDGMEDLWVNTIIYTNPESGTNSYVYSVMDLNTSLKNQLSTIFGDPFLQSFRDKFGDDGSIVTVSDQFGNYSFVQGLINLEFTPPKEDLQFQVSYATANVGFASGISVDKGTISISPNSPSLDAGVVYHFSGTNIEATTPSIGIAWNEGMGKIRTNKLFPMAGELIANTETQSKSFTIGFFGFTVENSTGKNGEEISINYASPGGGRGIAFKRFGFGFSISNNVASEMESYTPTQEDSIRVAKDGAAKGIKDYKDYLKKKNL
jgi:RHS repeat-associated protein